MKKFLAILVLGLLWCNTAFTECIEGNCSDGQGTYTWADGGKYVGEFKDGMQHGAGTATFTNGNKYVGEWKKGKQDGFGTKFFSDGMNYVGEWKDGEEHGQGTQTGMIASFDNDLILGYSGQWKNGCWDGSGTITYEFKDSSKKVNSKYYGEFSDCKLTGQGTAVYEDGMRKEGRYKDGKLHGYGTIVYPDGMRKEGQYKGEKLHGYGTIVYPDGGKYVGEFKDDRYHGQGKLTFPDTDKVWGWEEKGKLQEKYIGAIYVGEWKIGKQDGKGIFTFKDGSKQIGEWKDGSFIGQKTETYASIKSNKKYYALLIGNNDYKHWQKLDAAINDVVTIGEILESKYGYHVEVLTDGTSDVIRNKLIELSKKVTSEDNLLIYYAGHGDRNVDMSPIRAYWIPVDAGKTLDAKWINTQDVSAYVSQIPAKHILLMIDSCFAGSSIKGSSQAKVASDKDLDNMKWITKMLNRRTRLLITSGGVEPVVDASVDNHSLFAYKFLDILKTNKNFTTASKIWDSLNKYHATASQNPQITWLKNMGDLGGDFFFIVKN